jgi:hypothetical protein
VRQPFPAAVDADTAEVGDRRLRARAEVDAPDPSLAEVGVLQIQMIDRAVGLPDDVARIVGLVLEQEGRIEVVDLAAPPDVECIDRERRVAPGSTTMPAVALRARSGLSAGLSTTTADTRRSQLGSPGRAPGTSPDRAR